MRRFPTEADLSIDFTPGVRFFFKYDKIVTHPDAIFEGVLPLKVKEEVILSDWVDTIIIPSAESLLLILLRLNYIFLLPILIGIEIIRICAIMSLPGKCPVHTGGSAEEVPGTHRRQCRGMRGKQRRKT